MISCNVGYSMERVEMLSGTPIWSYYTAHYNDNNELTSCDYKYYFVCGKECKNGNTYRVLYSVDANDFEREGVTDKVFKKELLVREKDGVVYAEKEMFDILRDQYAEWNYVPSSSCYETNGDEFIIYDFNKEIGSTIDVMNNYMIDEIEYISGDDCITRKKFYTGIKTLIEGVGVVWFEEGWGDNPFLPNEPPTFEESGGAYFNDILGCPIYNDYISTLNLMIQNNQEVYRADEYIDDTRYNKEESLYHYITSYHEPPYLSELANYLTEHNYTDNITEIPFRIDGAMYDLNGRKLNQCPEKGIYISDGKLNVAGKR